MRYIERPDYMQRLTDLRDTPDIKVITGDVFPFSFAEFCRYHADEKDTAKFFDDYIIKGGLAGSYECRTERDRTAYIRNVLGTIIKRDLVTQHHLPDTAALERLTEFMTDNSFQPDLSE